MLKRLLPSAAILLLLCGCAAGPNYRPPDVSLPDEFDTGPALLPTVVTVAPPTAAAATTQPTTPSTRPVAAATRAATRAASQPVDLEHWWTSLDDPLLDALVSRAVEANYDLGIAAARLQQSRAILTGITGNELPLLDITAGLGRGSGSNSTKGRVGAPLNAGTNTAGLKEITHVAGFDAGWELDLFGSVSRAVEAAQADVQAVEEDRKQVLVSVLADLSRQYVGLRSLQLRLRIAQDNASALRRTVDLVRVRFDRGIGNDLDVVLAERQLSAALSRIAPLDSAVREAERRIAILTGRRPEELYAELDRPARIPAMAADVNVGVPLQLLRRRPDVRRAERQLAAATARVGAATANLFPQVALTAGLGFQGQGLGRNPVTNALIWSVGPAIRWPLLDFGRVDALIQVQDFRTKELLLAYRRTVLVAVEEVENALDAYASQRNRLQQLTVAVASSQQAVNLATQRYNLGLTDFLNVLDAQRQLYDLQDQLAVSQEAVTTQLLALYKSLGGGWEGFAAPALPPPPRPAVLAAGGEVVNGLRGQPKP